MSVTLRIAGTGDADRHVQMIETAREEAGAPFDAETLRPALLPLLDGTMPFGTVYLVGPPRSPVGFILLGFGYELAAGGITARIEEIYIRAAVRGRGMGGEAISALMRGLDGHGVVELRVMTQGAGTPIGRICTRLRFVEASRPYLSRAI
ncbi:GNAT family N-acetyltransferase [Profundibacterium mesophilum]|uniref:Acetyltransferase n=1 Tax=Profundibacterium mesophilum KAUST100406-0324 TaxID=1037889 RepID=A0A921NRM6_9RHOB|nr:GNAT family N-acetyltransferase [Profundibacterium mesophilum]KAF0677437.1 acetyltransferase [Profundibacterium mesophilum KAUST100406-0324]